jgi:hypothetical protein
MAHEEQPLSVDQEKSRPSLKDDGRNTAHVSMPSTKTSAIQQTLPSFGGAMFGKNPDQ